MAEPNKPDPATGEPQNTPKGEPEPEPKRDPEPPDDLGAKGKKALDEERKARREAEARIRELEPLASKAKELQDAQKTEAQKLSDELQAAKAEGGKSAGDLLRLEVALEKAPEGTPIARVRKLAKRLAGTTREELEADAEELYAEFADETETVLSSRNQGGGGSVTEENDPAKLAAKVPYGW